MANIEKLIPIIKKWEGNYSNHPNDKGGCTMKGVTIATYRKYYGKEKTCEDLKKITDDQWLHILRVGYWDKMQADKIENQSIANLCVNMCWGSGAVTAIKRIQQTLGVTVDGIVGNITLAALNGENKMEIFKKIWNMRKEWFIAIAKHNPTQKTFLAGWLNRLNYFVFEE